jgi:mycothiol synthase
VTTPTPRTEPVEVSDAPPIAGLTFRRFVGPDDYSAMVEVMNAAYRADDVDAIATPGQLAAEIEHPAHFDPLRDVLIAEVNGRMVAHSRASWVDRADGHWTYGSRGHLVPQYRRRGIGRAMLHWNERHLRDVVAVAHPSAGPRLYDTWAAEGEAGAHALFRAESYLPERYVFEMVRPTLEDVPDTAAPDGIVIRTVREGGDRDEEVRRILGAENEAFRDQWGHREATQTDWDEYLAIPEMDPSLWVVAWDGDEIAGAALNVIWGVDNEAFGRERFWVESLSVRRPWRRRGLGRALLAASLRLLRGRGMTSAALDVDASNLSGALGLYERSGFEVVKRTVVYRKPMA